MIVRIDIGGVLVNFGEARALVKPEPFYPYLLSLDSIRDSTGDETGTTGFKLSRSAAALIYLNLRRRVTILSDDLSQVIFEGVIGRIGYEQDISITVEA